MTGTGGTPHQFQRQQRGYQINQMQGTGCLNFRFQVSWMSGKLSTRLLCVQIEHSDWSALCVAQD